MTAAPFGSIADRETPSSPRGVYSFLTDEIIPADDIDALVDALEQLADLDGRAESCRRDIQSALVNLTTNDHRTRRVVGERRRVLIEMTPGGKLHRIKIEV